MPIGCAEAKAMVERLRWMMPSRFLLLAVLLAPSPLLAKADKKHDPGKVTCIDSQLITNREAEGDDTIIFTTNRQRYRNHLRTVCPGLYRLNQFNALQTELHGSELCEGDIVRVFDPNSMLRPMNNPACVLGDFEPIPPASPVHP
jgi:hypothetical protein